MELAFIFDGFFDKVFERTNDRQTTQPHTDYPLSPPFQRAEAFRRPQEPKNLGLSPLAASALFSKKALVRTDLLQKQCE